MINLEPLAAKAAQGMIIPNQAKDSLNLINKALMVLAEQGLFAFGLFLILVRGQSETNDPWPSRQASQPLAVSAQAR